MKLFFVALFASVSSAGCIFEDVGADPEMAVAVFMVTAICLSFYSLNCLFAGVAKEEEDEVITHIDRTDLQ